MPDPPKLLDHVRAEVRLRHYSRRTEEAYVQWIRRYIVFHGKRHPRDLTAADVTAFLTWLAVEQRVAASTQNQAFSALLFLYKEVLRQDLGVVDHPVAAKRPLRVPVVLSVDEVRRVLKELTGVRWIVASLLYGAGLRLQECLELRVKDLDFDRREIVVRRGKGQKDRRVMLPEAVRDRLRGHLEVVRYQHEQDLASGSAGLYCPQLWSENLRTLRSIGAGSSSFQRVESAAMRATDHPHAFTSTSLWCNARSRMPLNGLR